MVQVHITHTDITCNMTIGMERQLSTAQTMSV